MLLIYPFKLTLMVFLAFRFGKNVGIRGVATMHAFSQAGPPLRIFVRVRGT